MEVEFEIKGSTEEVKEEEESKGKDCNGNGRNYDLQVAKLCIDPWVVNSIEDLPWHVIMGIYENLDHRDLVSFMMTSRAVRDVVWNNEVFWRRHFERCFGRYIPRGFKGRWRPAFLATASSGLSKTCPDPRVYVHVPSLDPHPRPGSSTVQQR